MSDITLHTGFMGEWNTINVDWFDENGKHQIIRLDIKVLKEDKPRTVEIAIDGNTVYRTGDGYI